MGGDVEVISQAGDASDDSNSNSATGDAEEDHPHPKVHCCSLLGMEKLFEKKVREQKSFRFFMFGCFRG